MLFRNVIISMILFMAGCSSSTEPEENIIRNLVKENQEAGTYVMLWNQKDENGNLIPDGDYKIKFNSKDFDGKKYINISSSLPESKTFYKTTEKIGIAPKNFLFDSYFDEYTSGDTVVIFYGIPKATNVNITIVKE